MAGVGGAAGLTGPELAKEFGRGLNAYDAQQYQTAFQIWWQIKDQDLAAMRNIAFMLRKGQGVERNPKKAEDILQLAAATGMPNAEVDLAEMLLNGEAGQPDPKRAVPLLQHAAASGHPLAQFLLGQMYESGNAVPKDMSKATELYIASARAGLHEAKERLASLGTDHTAGPGGSSAESGRANPEPKPQLAAVGDVKSANPAYVQLGSFKTAPVAEAEWIRFSRMPILVSSSHRVQRADLGQKGIWYRLLVEAGPDPKSAEALCGQIKASGQECLVQRGLVLQ
jgi:TPR repeat protein